MAFASLTFIADAVLHAGFSVVVVRVFFFPLFQSILFLSHFPALHHVHRSGRETTGSLSRWNLQGAKKA